MRDSALIVAENFSYIFESIPFQTVFIPVVGAGVMVFEPGINLSLAASSPSGLPVCKAPSFFSLVAPYAF